MHISLTELRRTPGPALDYVRAGHEVTITEDGIPMGRIVPVDRPSRYVELLGLGVIRPPTEAGSPIEMREQSLALWGRPDAVPVAVPTAKPGQPRPTSPKRKRG